MHKRTAAVIVTSTLLFTHTLISQNVPKSDEELLAVRRLVWTAYFENDQAKFKELLPDDLVAGANDEQSWKNRTDILGDAADFAAHRGRLVTLDFANVKIQHFHAVAVIYSDYSLTAEWSGHPFKKSGKSMEVFVFQGGHWKNAGWQLGDRPANSHP